MEIFNVEISLKWIAILCVIGVLIGGVTAAAIVAIWSPKSSSLTPLVAWSGTLSAPTWTGVTAPNYHAGDTITLSTTLSSAPSLPQNIQFYYTYLSTATSTTPIGSDPATQLFAIGASVASSGVTATKSFVIPSGAGGIPIYFFAADLSPL